MCAAPVHSVCSPNITDNWPHSSFYCSYLSAGVLICNVITRYMLSALLCICVTFQIEVDNPCVIMSQDKSREFLHSGNDKDKFKVIKIFSFTPLFVQFLTMQWNIYAFQWSIIVKCKFMCLSVVWPLYIFILAELFADCCFMKKIILNLLMARFQNILYHFR